MVSNSVISSAQALQRTISEVIENNEHEPCITFQDGVEFYKSNGQLGFGKTYPAEFLNGYLWEERMSHCGAKYTDWSKVYE